MKEIHDIIVAYDAAKKTGIRSALATVVDVQGSSYRRPGARMLVTEDGKLTGAISGGCLEGDALRKAVLAITQEKKKLVVYDTTDEDDAKLGIQLGCNGIVSILFEPLDILDPLNPVEILRKTTMLREASVVLTFFSKNNTIHSGTMLQEQAVDRSVTDIHSIVQKVFENKRSMHCEVECKEDVQHCFAEYLEVPVSFIIAGAGNDAMPLVTMAKQLGWQVTMVDGRPTHANLQRFPQADTIVTGKPEQVIPSLLIDERTAIVLMTHNYNYDLSMLCGLQGKSFAYLGLLGPAAKRERLLTEAAQKGIFFSDEETERIYGPTGLQIGAETSEQIAVSIIAEIMSVINHCEPVHLRSKLKPIHSNN